MTLSVNEELRRAFELASLRREAEAIRKPEQWQELWDLKHRCERARFIEQQLYHRRYDTRVEQRRRELIDEAGAKTRIFKPWWGATDRFSPEQTLRQAQRDVRLAHERRIQRIDNYERRKLAAFVEHARRESRVRDLAMRAFNRTVDRRSGPERRRGWEH